jgi:hypothetical protein
LGFWNRLYKNEDPLLKVLLERYRLNLLSLPREKASVGDLYVQEGNSRYVSTPGSVTNFLEPPFEVPPITTGETMAGVSGTTSRDASGTVGIDFLEGFLSALGAAGTKVAGSYKSSSKNKITFTFDNPTRDYADPGLVGRKLVDHTLMKRHALIAEGRKYYLVTGVARSSGISITTEGDSKQVMDIDAEIMKLANVSGDVSIQKNQTGSITFKNPSKTLAFGVELYELEYVPINGGQEGKFKMSTQEKAVVARGEEEEREVVPLFGPDKDVTISLSDG